ncbi:MAG: M50 family metallopeptidase [Candidatus Uhrbacteria bacterium]
MLIAILAFLFTLGLLVFVHELGHFIVARRAGMAVDEFGFGFPPRLIGFQRRDGRWRVASREHDDRAILTPHVPMRRSGSRHEVVGTSRLTPTIYSLNLIPLGGFVRIRGEDGQSDDPDSFTSKSKSWRALVLTAGVAMNALLAVALFVVVFTVGAPQVINEISESAHISGRVVSVAGVVADGPAARIGIAPGDSILAVDGATIDRADGIRDAIRASENQPVTLLIDHNGARREIVVTPASLPGVDQPAIGVRLIETGIVSYPFPLSVVEAFRTTGTVAVEIVSSIGAMLRDVIGRRPVAVDIAGPIGIAVMTGEVVRFGFTSLLQFVAILSVNLALLNIFPFPALDGGRLLFLAIESVRGRALRRTVEAAIHAAGFAVLILLIIAVTVGDVARYGGGVIDSIRSAVRY